MYLKSKKIFWKKVSRKVYIHCTLYYVCFLEYTEDGYEQMFQVNYETPSIKKEKKNVPRSLCLNIEKKLLLLFNCLLEGELSWTLSLGSQVITNNARLWR